MSIIKMHEKEDISVLFNNEYFQIIKRNVFYKAVCQEACLAVPFKIGDIGIKPYWFAEIKLVTDFLDCMENLVCACFGTVITNHGISKHMVVFKGSCP